MNPDPRSPEDYNEEDLKQYAVELEEIIPRAEDQKFVTTTGSVLKMKGIVTDFVNFIRYFSRYKRKNSALENELKQSLERWKSAFEHEKNERENMEKEVFEANHTAQGYIEQNGKLTDQVEALSRELEDLKKTRISEISDQRRVIQKKSR